MTQARPPLRVKLVHHVLHEEQLHVALGGKAGRKAPVRLAVLRLHGLLHTVCRVLAAPRLTERGIDERDAHVVAREAVLLHGIGELDVLLALSLDEHVRQADGVRLGVDLLTVQVDICLRTHLRKPFLGRREHAACPAGEVAHVYILARFLQVFAPFGQSEANHEAHDLTRRVVVAGIGVLREAPDDFLEHVAHGHVAHAVGVEVEVRKLAHHAGKLCSLGHFVNLLLELQVGHDLLDVGREGVEVALEVARQRLGVSEELGEGPSTRVVEGEARDPAQDGIGHLVVRLVGGSHGIARGRQGALDAPDDGHRYDDVLVLVGLVRSAQAVRDAEHGIDLPLDVYGPFAWHGDISLSIHKLPPRRQAGNY